MGWPALGGLALSVFAAGFYVTNVLPLQDEVRSLSEQVGRLEARAENARSHAPQAQGQDVRLAAFYDALPRTQQAPEVVRQLHVRARAAGLTLERGEYRPVVEPSGKLVRYQIVVPVKGNYPQVKAFLGQAMRDTLGLALDGVGFQRDDDSQALEAQLRFTVFLRSGT